MLQHALIEHYLSHLAQICNRLFGLQKEVAAILGWFLHLATYYIKQVWAFQKLDTSTPTIDLLEVRDKVQLRVCTHGACVLQD